jgi:hypothetical protein
MVNRWDTVSTSTATELTHEQVARILDKPSPVGKREPIIDCDREQRAPDAAPIAADFQAT